MEIKVGDKVRVSKNAPRIYVGFADVSKTEFIVGIIDDGVASVHLENDEKTHAKIFVIPTKYLTKVDAEAKEPKFKAGEIVRYRYDGNLYIVECKTGKYYYALRQVGGDVMRHDVLESDLELVTEPKQEIKVGDFVGVLENLHDPFCLDVERHLEITNIPPHAVSQKKWKVISIEVRRDCAGCIYTLKHDDSFIYNIPEDCVERVEPKEQTEGKEPKFHIGDIVSYEGISGSMRSGRIISNRNHSNLYGVCSGIDIFHVEEEALNLYNPIKDGYISPIESEPSNTDDTDWDAYTADLAKEIAVKITNKKMDNNPLDVAKYAVSVAKAVVENLKKK